MWLTQHAKKRIKERGISITLVDQCFGEGVRVGSGHRPNTDKIVWGDMGLIRKGNTIVTVFWTR